MEVLPRYAVNFMGVQVHTNREPSHMSGTVLYFKDSTTCDIAASDTHGNSDITFVKAGADNFLTANLSPSTTFVDFDDHGSARITTGGGKFSVNIGDPAGGRGITVGHGNVQHNTFD